MSVQRSVSGSQVRAQLTSMLEILLGTFQRQSDGKGVKSTSPVTENHNKNGYVNYNINKNFIMTNVDNSDTKYTNKNDTNNHNARDLHE